MVVRFYATAHGVLLCPRVYKELFRQCHGKTTMNPISDYRDLALANLLDVIPLINNTGERVQPALIRIYDRNSAIGDQEITDLALANLHDIIALISNTGDAVDPALLRIYERNCAVLNSE